MARLALRYDGDPVLRRHAVPVAKFDASLETVVADMFEVMYGANGRGLAAPQVGLSERIFLIDTTWKEAERTPVAFVNPEITDKAARMHVGQEACLSIPDRAFDVQRPEWVEMTWLTPAGVRQSARFEGIEAICVCHDLDHLDGILITDHGEEV